jgi:hypothetical protein
MYEHVLILGCGRSGTSIFGELFNHLSTHTYYSEIDFDLYLNKDFSKPIASKIPRENRKYQNTPGLSFPLDVLLERIPNIKIYWQVRQPLDAICSLRVGISKTWGHHPQPPDYKDWMQESLLKKCAHHWNYINSIGYASVKKIAVVTTFEDLVRDSSKFSKDICEQLEIDPESHGLELKSWNRRVQNNNNEDFIEALTSRTYSTQDHHNKINRWKENLTKENLDEIVPMVRQTAAQFGYVL